MFNSNGYPYGVNPYQQMYNTGYQQQLNQGYQQNQYGNQQQQMQQVTVLKGRPVTSRDEANACMIDLDGSMFVFPDVSNKKIYTKQIMLDGTAEFKEYVLVPQQNNQPVVDNQGEYVLRSELNNILKDFEAKLFGSKKKGETVIDEQ